MLLAVTLAHAQGVELTYTVAFDVNAKGDQICGFTGICDCRSTYVGTGERVGSDGLVFKGTWRSVSNTCKEELVVWTPPDGVAWHTFRVAGPTLTEWVVHGREGGSTKLQSGMKANQQFWIDELGAAWPAPGGRVEVVQKDGSELAMGVRVDATHTVVATFTGESAR